MGFLIVIGGVLAISGLNYLFSEVGSVVEGKPPIITIKKNVELFKEYKKKIPEMNHEEASLISWKMLQTGQVNKELSLSCFQDQSYEKYFVNYLDLDVGEIEHLRYFFLPKFSSDHSIKYRFSTSNQVAKKFVKEKVVNNIEIKTINCKRCVSRQGESVEGRASDGDCRKDEILYDVVTELYLPSRGR